MRLGDAVVVRSVTDAGPNDWVFDAMLLCGPVVIGVLAVLGRSTFTIGVATLYLVAFASYVLYKGATHERG